MLALYEFLQADSSLDEVWTSILLIIIYSELAFLCVNCLWMAIASIRLLDRYKIHAVDFGPNWDGFRTAISHRWFIWLSDIVIIWITHAIETFVWWKQPTAFLVTVPEKNSTIFREVFVYLLIFDGLFYAWHRILHSRCMKEYHNLHHSERITNNFSNDFESDVEIFGNIVCKHIPQILFPGSLYSCCLFRAVVKFMAHTNHSGYMFPGMNLSTIVFISNPLIHDSHHFDNCGNYGGVFTIWDHLFGTSYKPKRA